MDYLFRIYTIVPIKSKDIQLAAPLNANRFVDEGKMDAQLVRDFLNAMNLREAADYEAEFSQSGAKVVIASADTPLPLPATKQIDFAGSHRH